MFDECHKAKHFVPDNENRSTKIAQAVITIQRYSIKCVLLSYRVVSCIDQIVLIKCSTFAFTMDIHMYMNIQCTYMTCIHVHVHDTVSQVHLDFWVALNIFYGVRCSCNS